MTEGRKRRRGPMGTRRSSRPGLGTTTTPLLLTLLLLLLLLLTAAGRPTSAFTSRARPSHLPFSPLLTTRVHQYSEPTSTSAQRRVSATTTQQRRPCFYQSPAHKNHWRPRLLLSDLEMGQELEATVVQELMDGRTGPKLFLEVGVGRHDGGATAAAAATASTEEEEAPPPRRTDWQMVRAMLRLGTNYGKLSVSRKRAARLRKKDYFPVYVSRIRLASAQLEVCLTREEALAASVPKIPVRDLVMGVEYTGRVVRVEDYGVLVDIRAVRHGLLPITRVAALMGYYIPQTAGLEKAGLERGARIKVQIAPPSHVNSNTTTTVSQKEISLDFTDAVKEEAAVERQRRAARIAARSAPSVIDTGTDTTTNAVTDTAVAATAPTLSEEEALVWAAFASNPNAAASETEASRDDEEDEEEEDYDDEDDDYDEDRDIEDALGLGSY